MPGKGSGGLVLTTLQPFRTTNYAEDPRITREYTDRVRAAGVVAQIVIPIQDGELKGLLYVFNRSARALLEFDGTGKFLRCLAEGIFTVR